MAWRIFGAHLYRWTRNMRFVAPLGLAGRVEPRGIPSRYPFHSVPDCRRLDVSGQLYVPPLVVLYGRSVGAILFPLPQPAVNVLHVHRYRAMVDLFRITRTLFRTGRLNPNRPPDERHSQTWALAGRR